MSQSTQMDSPVWQNDCSIKNPFIRHHYIAYINSLGVKAIYIRSILSIRYHNMSVTVVHLLEWPTLILCSNPGHQTKGHHVPLGLCDHEGSCPALGGVPAPCFGLFFCGCGSSYLKPPTMGIAVALSSIAAAIVLRWWQMMARSKAHDSLR